MHLEDKENTQDNMRTKKEELALRARQEEADK